MGLPMDGPIVGTLGRLVRDKRIEDFIRAASLVSRETDAVFLIGGTGPDEARLRSLAHGRRVFVGEVNDPARFHGLCDVSVLSSVREGLSVSLQETMATGCVPVATRGVGCRELVTEGVDSYVWMVRRDDTNMQFSNGLARALKVSRSNPSRNTLGETD